jgi:hypothetical protein
MGEYKAVNLLEFLKMTINEQLKREEHTIREMIAEENLQDSAREYTKFFSVDETEAFKMWNIDIPNCPDDMWHMRKIGESKKGVSLVDVEKEQKRQASLDREARIEAMRKHYDTQEENETEESFFQDAETSDNAETFEIKQLLGEFTRKNFWGNL